jgi:hypothetical protein
MLKAAVSTLGTAIILSFAQPAIAAQKDEILKAIAAERLPLQRSASGQFSGAGWQRIVDDAAGAQFMMVGEQHGSGSIAEFETALHRALADRGYTHSAYEIGPFTARFTEQRIRSGRGKIQAYIASPGNAFTIPFLFFAEESALAEQMVARSPDRSAALWGLDQEFIGGGPIHAELLRGYAQTAAQKAAVEAFSKAVADDPMHSGKLDDAALAPLRSAFARNPQAMELIEALAASAAIYRPFVVKGGGDIYPANLAREDMMKRIFMADYTAAERRTKAPPKVFFKFGANHAMRGLGGTDVPALGNFIADFATSRGTGMVNLFVECDGGEAMNPQTNKPAPCEPYFETDSLLRQAVASGPELQVYDLRPLRSKVERWKELDPATRKVILAFDYYVTIRNGRAATPLGTPPANLSK